MLPYFEGDYWVNEAEVIIKSLGEGCRADDRLDDSAGAKSKRKAKAKNTVRENARSAAIASGKAERDPIMAKLASIIEPMKDTFFVARLYPKEFADRWAQMRIKETSEKEEGKEPEKTEKELQEEALSGQDVVPSMPDIKAEEARNAEAAAAAAAAASVAQTEQPTQVDADENPMEDDSDFNRLAANVDNVAESTGSGCNDDDNNSMVEGPVDAEESVTPLPEVPQTQTVERSETVETSADDDQERRIHVPNEPHKSIEASEAVEGSTSVAESKAGEEPVAPTQAETAVPSKASALTSRNAPIVNPRAIIPCGEGLPSLPDDTEDVDDTQECEHLDTRQSFLNLCQGNHYQFDQLRRAKHSSMMVLYHLHNPDAPKFVPNCTSCHSDILTGTRFHCETCEQDYCQSCVSRIGPTIHGHKLRPIGINSSTAQPLTEEQRRERQRSVQLHMQLLNHASSCLKCESKNCARMKVRASRGFHVCMHVLFFLCSFSRPNDVHGDESQDFLKHEAECTTKVKGGCRLCARISNLLGIHARQCRVENCKVPHCLTFREQIRYVRSPAPLAFVLMWCASLSLQ